MTQQRTRLPINVHLGSRVKEARLARGMTGRELAALVGVTTQQISKIERGESTIHSGQLWSISRALKQSVDWFYQCPAREVNLVARKGNEFYDALNRMDIDTHLCL